MPVIDIGVCKIDRTIVNFGNFCSGPNLTFINRFSGESQTHLRDRRRNISSEIIKSNFYLEGLSLAYISILYSSGRSRELTHTVAYTKYHTSSTKLSISFYLLLYLLYILVLFFDTVFIYRIVFTD